MKIVSPTSSNSGELTATAVSLDHLVGLFDQRRRNLDTERLGRLQVDHEFKLGCSLNRQVRRLLTFEDTIDIGRGAPVSVGSVYAIGHKAAISDIVSIGVDRRQPAASGEGNDLFAMSQRERARQDDQASV